MERMMDVLKTIQDLTKLFVLCSPLLLSACVTAPPPANVNNVCSMFKQYPSWNADAKDVERRWKVPVPVQMAIIHQESHFNAHARPPRTKLFYLIPWTRPSTAYGYAQALNGTWSEYKKTNGWLFTSRNSFAAGVDFIGWYANQAAKRANINRNDAYSLYLAYHEGVGGYMRRSYLHKPWLITVARKVKANAERYSRQLSTC